METTEDDSIRVARHLASMQFLGKNEFKKDTLPGMNGIELLEIVRESSPSTECLMVTLRRKLEIYGIE